jgi:aryl-alcohol dehydrogenase-like predicted oxidoreductase
LRISTCRQNSLAVQIYISPPIGFGAWAIGGSGWGAQDDHESIEAIRRALDLGVNWINTAAIYGLGHSEEVVAKALKGRAEQPYIFTKCSMVWGVENPAVTAAIVGGRNGKQVEGIMGAGAFRLNEQEHQQIQHFLQENP